jgi:hypothetical protein
MEDCTTWRVSVPPCGIPYRTADGIGTLPLICRKPAADELPRARSWYAGFKGLHGVDDQQAIGWLMQVQQKFVELKTGKPADGSYVQPPPQGCRAAG